MKNKEGCHVLLHSTLLPMLQEMHKKAEGGACIRYNEFSQGMARACVACKLGRKIEVEGKHDPR
jgi:hypothetical protein